MKVDDSKFWDDVYVKTGESQQSPHTEELHAAVVAHIPVEAKTILDAGCGGGALLAKLKALNLYELTGVDFSQEGISVVKERVGVTAEVADITNLCNFKDSSYDIVICSEVLEHLPIDDIRCALKELYRVARLCVIITNPNNEKLSCYQLTCNHCETRFHIVGHLHSVDGDFIRELSGVDHNHVKVSYSGKRRYASKLYSMGLRAMGLRLGNLQTRCPVCQTVHPPLRWPIIARILARLYWIFQGILGLVLPKTPANILTVINKRNG